MRSPTCIFWASLTPFSLKPGDPLSTATFVCKRPWWAQSECKLNSTRDPAPEVAAFLVARGPSAVFQVVMQPRRSLDYRNATAFPSLMLAPGIPLEIHAREVEDGVFERRWSNLTVRFDCGNYSGSFMGLGATGPV
jgi:hypothetical protein